MSGTGQGGGMAGTGQGGGMSGTGGTAPPVVLSKGGVMLRLLTQAEYLTSVQSLLGTLTTRWRRRTIPRSPALSRWERARCP